MPYLLEYTDDDDGNPQGIRYKNSRDIGIVNG